jgi:hypothetical protein
MLGHSIFNVQKLPINLCNYSKYFEGYASFLYYPQSAVYAHLSRTSQILTLVLSGSWQATCRHRWLVAIDPEATRHLAKKIVYLGRVKHTVDRLEIMQDR